MGFPKLIQYITLPPEGGCPPADGRLHPLLPPIHPFIHSSIHLVDKKELSCAHRSVGRCREGGSGGYSAYSSTIPSMYRFSHLQISNRPVTDRLSFINMLWTTKGYRSAHADSSGEYPRSRCCSWSRNQRYYITHPHQITHRNKIPVVDSEGFNKIERQKRSEALRGPLCETTKGAIFKVFFF